MWLLFGVLVGCESHRRPWTDSGCCSSSWETQAQTLAEIGPEGGARSAARCGGCWRDAVEQTCGPAQPRNEREMEGEKEREAAEEGRKRSSGRGGATHSSDISTSTSDRGSHGNTRHAAWRPSRPVSIAGEMMGLQFCNGDAPAHLALCGPNEMCPQCWQAPWRSAAQWPFAGRFAAPEAGQPKGGVCRHCLDPAIRRREQRMRV